MAYASILAQFLSFIPGLRLVDGGELLIMAKDVFSTQSGVVAHAGGGQAAGTPVNAALVEVDTCVTNNDSIVLPPAIPGALIQVNNNTAQTLAVFGVVSNPSNGNAGDTIAATGSTVQQPTATGVTQVTAKVAEYQCYVLGQWKQTLSA